MEKAKKQKLEELRSTLVQKRKEPKMKTLEEQLCKTKKSIVENLKKREDETKRKRERLQKEISQLSPIPNTTSRKSRSRSPIGDLNEAVLKDTKSSTLKKRQKLADILEAEEKKRKTAAKNGQVSATQKPTNRSMLIIEKDSRHFYVPNTFELSERNEFLSQRTCLNFDKPFSQGTFTNRPRISRISRDLAKSRRETTAEPNPQKEYETAIKNIGGELEVAIKEIDQMQRGKLNFGDLCGLLVKLKGMDSAPEEDIGEVAGELWELMRPSGEEVDNASVYDVLIILLGTNTLKPETTYELLQEYVKKTGGMVDDSGNVVQEIILKLAALSIEGLVNDFRNFFSYFSPLETIRKDAGSLTETASGTLRSTQRYATALSKHKKSLSKHRTPLKTKVLSSSHNKQSATDFLSPEADTPTSSATEWNPEIEYEMVSRLSQHKDPNYKIDVDMVRLKEFEECTYHPRIGIKPYFKEVQKPKLYYETVSRLQKVALEREAKREREENRYLETDNRLQKLKQMPVNPPSFLERDDKNKKRNVLIYVDIKIKPGKQQQSKQQSRVGRIGISEEDDLDELAENFARTYGLSREMRDKVRGVLNASLEKYLQEILCQFQCA
eukprot:TRINITY_DN4887_c0_g1_i1.p1 TRINITY_DN4887_c0_g1~~TRINITY_DN4887_c0_g1_i1.p1  ORF type:complete len:611 (+),score=54.01 TRINITY_DN4887_c0_g1_i1:3518-5350(+)